ncbi:hypothetical protein [Streptomyces sp. NPDC059850]|uniref:hypothetical protein n=1 Tax=Streptomyces sp. NPDC059850 TaxID=3346970 RepID=UPI00365B9DDC
MALVEIDLYGELMIAAASADEERLSPDRIDEVLRVEADRSANRSGDRSDSANRSQGRKAGRTERSERPERPESDGPDAR